MIIDISSSTQESGFKDYLFHGKDGARDKSKVVHIEGDFDLAETMKKDLKRKKKSMNFVISLNEDDDVSDEKFIEMYNEIMDLIFVGMNREDIMTCSVIHNDTKCKHIHVEVVDSHLLTNKPLELYMDKIAKDKERFFKIRDYIELKYLLKPALNKNTHEPIPTKKKLHWDKWIKKEKLDTFDINNISPLTKTKTNRVNFQNDLLKYFVKVLSLKNDNGEFKLTKIEHLEELIKRINLNGKDNTKVKLDVVNKGYNKFTDYHYFTIQPEAGKPIKIEADIFSKDFFDLNESDRLEVLQNNIRPKPKEVSRLDEIEKELAILNEARKKYTYKRIGKHSKQLDIYSIEEIDKPLSLDELVENNKEISISQFANEEASSMLNVLNKYDLFAQEVLEPKIVEDKSSGKFTFKSDVSKELDIEKGFYVAKIKDKDALKEANILNKIKDRILNDRKINAIKSRINDTIKGTDGLKSKFDETIGAIKRAISSIGTTISNIGQRKSNKIDPKTLVQNAFKQNLEKPKLSNEEQLNADFEVAINNPYVIKKLKTDYESICNPNKNSTLMKDIKDLITINSNNVEKIFKLNIKDFIDEFKINGKKKYEINALNGKYHFKDNYGKDKYIINHKDEQYIFNVEKKDVYTLFSFVEDDLKSKFLNIYSIIERNSDLDRFIELNFKGIDRLINGIEVSSNIEFVEAINEKLIKFDNSIRIRFLIEEDDIYFSINGNKYKLSDYEEDKYANKLIKYLEQDVETLDDVMDEFYTDGSSASDRLDALMDKEFIPKETLQKKKKYK